MFKWLISSIVLVLSSAAGWGAEAAPRPTTEIEWTSCITAECHVEIKSQPVAHGPINTDSCDSCHELYDAKQHTFRILRRGTELCTYCHEFQTQGMPVVHEPVTRGECLGCHDPHGGPTRAILREETEPQVCGRCHESMTLDRGVVHTPVREGQCVSCHPPHAAKFPKLLDVIGADLCIACHQDFEAKMSGVKFRHKAMREGCMSCHDAHASAHENQLVSAAPDLCTKCHEPVRDQALSATHRHSVVIEEQSCLTCHAPHGSNHDRLMADTPATICMDCHKEPIPHAAVNALPQLLDETIIKHGPVRDGQCGGCHAVHGNDTPLLLTSNYELRLYQRFSPEKYHLCFTCHDSRLAQNQQASDVTNFRNGDVNLHYIHVNDPLKGRGCNICHDPHASGRNDRNVRESVQYGKQRLPIGFTRTATGGACGKTCHPPYAYDRIDPVEQQRTAPSSQPAIANATTRAIDEPLMAVNWITRDLAGNTVRIPDASARPSVLVLLRPPDAANDLTLRQVRSTLDDLKDPQSVQVLVVSCGPQASEPLGSDVAWPIVTDAENGLCEALNVRSWPMTVVLHGDGVELARIGGAPESLAWKLDAYLEYATSSINRSQLDQQLSSVESTDISPQDQLHRSLRHINSLLRENNVQRARERVEELIKLYPQSVELRVMEVNVLAAQDQPDATRQALVLLERLDADSIEAWRRDLLRARLFARLEQWELARPAAERVLQAMPELSEAHLLMGRILEAQGDFQRAASEYRRASELPRQ